MKRVKADDVVFLFSPCECGQSGADLPTQVTIFAIKDEGWPICAECGEDLDCQDEAYIRED